MQKEKTLTMHITAYVQAKQAGKQEVQQYLTCNDADGQTVVLQAGENVTFCSTVRVWPGLR